MENINNKTQSNKQKKSILDRKRLIDKFSEALVNDTGIYFIGSGISVPSGFPDWKRLLTPFTNLELTNDDDLTEVAQYIVNEYTGNKGPLLNDILKIFNENKKINNYHEILVRTNLKKIWTTNFDLLLEKAFDIYNIEYDIKTNDNDFLRDTHSEQIQIIKMHGSANRNHEDIVLVQEDYEDFFINKPAIVGELTSDLLNNSFLFIGYNFGDSNLKNILIETRRLSKRSTRPHFLIQTIDEDNLDKQRSWCNNLKRFGIESILIESYSELDQILDSISSKSKGRSIYITGSHVNEEDSDFVKDLGSQLAKIKNIKLLDGQSTGISRSCINSFLHECLKNQLDIHNKVVLYPNPYAIQKDFSNKSEYLPILKKWRIPIFRNCQIIIVFDGGIGTEAEIELANQFKTTILPVPLTKDDLAYKLLIKNHETIDPEYYKIALECKLTVKDVIEQIEKDLDK